MELTLEEYCKQYEKYVTYWVNIYNKNLFLKDLGISLDDLYQTGYLGLIESYYNYDSSKSSPSTHVNIRIHYKILSYIQSNTYITYLPKGLYNLPIRLQNKKSEFYHLNQRNMTISEILEFLDQECYVPPEYQVTEEFVKTICMVSAFCFRSNQVSLEEFIKDGDGEILYLKDNIASDTNVEEEAITNHIVENILFQLNQHFSEKDVNIFLETLGYIDEIPKTNRKLAKQYHMSHQSINRHYQKILTKMKTYCQNLE